MCGPRAGGGDGWRRVGYLLPGRNSRLRESAAAKEVGSDRNCPLPRRTTRKRSAGWQVVEEKPWLRPAHSLTRRDGTLENQLNRLHLGLACSRLFFHGMGPHSNIDELIEAGRGRCAVAVVAAPSLQKSVPTVQRVKSWSILLGAARARLFKPQASCFPGHTSKPKPAVALPDSAWGALYHGA